MKLTATMLAACILVSIACAGCERKPAPVQNAQSDVKRLRTSLEAYYADIGRYPDAADGLNALVEAPNNVTRWPGPYIETLPVDPWGNSYLFRIPGTAGKSFDVFSCGPDGKADTPDDIR